MTELVVVRLVVAVVEVAVVVTIVIVESGTKVVVAVVSVVR